MKNCRAFIFVLLAFLAAACKEDPKDDQPADSFDRKALFTNLSETAILPAFLDFVKQADSLQQIAEAFRLQPDLPNLSALRDQWIQTKFASKQIELLKFGPLNDTKMYSLVDKWPTNEGFIEGFINGSDPITESFIQGKGATSKGLPAIEYLLFEEKDADLLLARLKNEPRRVDYIVAASHNLYQKTLEIASLWSPLGDNYQAEYIENTFSGLDGSLSLTVNQMSSHLEFMLVSKLGKALGKDLNRDADPVYLEAYRSGVSAGCLLENLLIFRELFKGGAGLGFDDYLDYLNAKKDNELLSRRILDQVQDLENRLSNISPSLKETLDQTTTEDLYQELRELLVLVKVDMASALSVTLTFTDNDGD